MVLATVLKCMKLVLNYCVCFYKNVKIHLVSKITIISKISAEIKTIKYYIMVSFISYLTTGN